MRFVTYTVGSDVRVGRLVDDEVLDVGFDGDMVAFIEAGAPIQDGPLIAGARLMAPLRPRSMRDFLSFRGHMEAASTELGRPIPPDWESVPGYYKALPDTVIGPDQTIPWPAYTDKLDHELELACIIGKPGRDISTDDALDHVFGWTIWNDVSARDVQARELPIGLGPGKAKDWDGSNVLGPCIVTADEIDGTDLRMSVRVNGELWGEDSSANMHHDFRDLIAYASQAQTLHPGELLGSGTAAGGSGFELGRWLAPGDLIQMEIAGIGVLTNAVSTKGGPR